MSFARREETGTMEREVIWKGELEWQEKLKEGPADEKISHTINCTVSTSKTNGVPEVKPDNWPAKLIMQLIPKSLVRCTQTIGGQYFRNSKSVLFHPNECESLDALTKVMGTGFAGCVHFTGVQACDIKALILLYSNDTNTKGYLGFIPNDQASFVDRIRTVTQQQKTGQQVRAQNQMVDLGGPGMGPGGPGMGPGGPGIGPGGSGMGPGGPGMGPGGPGMGPGGSPGPGKMGEDQQMTQIVNGLVCLSIDSLSVDSQYVPVPLTKVNVEARVVNFVSQVTVTQNYVNKEKNPIEAIYFFPVEEEAAVIKFTAELEGRTIKTVVKEKAEAKQEYQEAVRDRRTAFLLEETKPDIFQIHVGHLSPGAGCSISIIYLSELPVEDGRTRLTVPTTIAPRYVPKDDKSEASGEIASIQYDSKTPASMTFKMDSIMKTKIKGIESPSHNIVNKIESEADNNNFFVGETRFEGSTGDMDRDIIILIDTEEPNEPKVILERNEAGETVAMLSLVPRFELKDAPVEIVFLVDCSGSMSGKSINLAKEALQLFLHSLPIDCYFNIVRFGSSFQCLFSQSKKYDDNTLNEAMNLAANLTANLGGTVILKPLEHIFEQKYIFETLGDYKYNKKAIPGLPRQVFVLTDGAVSDSSRCINCVKKNNDISRVFTLGIGSSTDRHLVKGMARAGQGTAVFATYGEKIAPKVLKQLKNSLQPCINNVKIDWGDGVQKENAKWHKPTIETEKTLLGYGKPKAGQAGDEKESSAINNQAPRTVPAIYDGSRLLAYKKLTDGEFPEKIIITAETPDGALDLNLPIDKNNILEGNLVHQMFARKLIQDLEEGGDDLEQLHDRTTHIKSQIVDLGIKYSLASKFTSFVGVDEKQGKECKVMMTRQIKNQVSHGYGGPPLVSYRFGGTPLPFSRSLYCSGLGGSPGNNGINLNRF